MSPLLKSFLKPIRNFYLKYFSEVGYVTRQFNRLESRYSNWHQYTRRREIALRLAPLDSTRQKCLDQLRGQGFCKTTLKELGIDASVLGYLAGLSESYKNVTFEDVAKTNPGKSKYYWVRMNHDWQADRAVYDAVTKNRYFMDLATAYFGEVPWFNNFEYLCSPPYPAGRPRLGSQNWHFDNHHPRVLKLFFSPFPLTTHEGITQALPSNRCTRKVYSGYPNYMTDEEVFKNGIRPEEVTPLISQPGEIYLVDTARCLHFGSRNQAARHLAIMTFTSTERYISNWNFNSQPQDKLLPINEAIMSMYARDAVSEQERRHAA